MKKSILSITALVTLTGFAFAHGHEKTQPTPNKHDHSIASQESQTILLKPGQKTFSIKLKANATTGYQWFLKKYDDDLVKVKDYQYVVDASHEKMVGVGGTAEFTFKADSDFLKAPQQTTLYFVYLQPWNKGGKGQCQKVVVRSLSGNTTEAKADNQASGQQNWLALPDKQGK